MEPVQQVGAGPQRDAVKPLHQHRCGVAAGAPLTPRDRLMLREDNLSIGMDACRPLPPFKNFQTACELLALRKMPINWGPVRHGPGHNVAIYHRNADDQNVEFYIELDQMKDEELGYFEPRPWHHDTPQRPKVWDRKIAPNLWGPLPMQDFRRDHE